MRLFRVPLAVDSGRTSCVAHHSSELSTHREWHRAIQKLGSKSDCAPAAAQTHHGYTQVTHRNAGLYTAPALAQAQGPVAGAGLASALANAAPAAVMAPRKPHLRKATM